MIRIILVDDHTLVRAGIRALLEGIDDTQIVAEAQDGREAIEAARKHRPDIVVMDISMKELNGIEATAVITAELPEVRVLILSMHATEEFVRRAVKAGASGYVVKESVPMELRLALEALMRGEVYFSPRISRHLVSILTEPAEASSLDALTARQREILQMIAEGRSTKEIAAILALSVKTVESHRAAIMSRLDIRDIPGLVIYAARHRLIAFDRPDE